MEPIAVEFPLRGEWIAPNTPGFKVPSHGTDMLGQTYAYDLMQIDWRYPKDFRFFNKPYITALLLGVRLKDCFGWRQPIYAPFDAEVVEAVDGIKERDPVHFFRDMALALKNGIFFKEKSNQDLESIIGNYIILKGEQCYAFFAHGHTGSIRVKAGDKVTTGQQLAEVGHSGNSTAPHLHFHLMDHSELMEANGLPCCFREYELYEDGKWRKVTNGIPGRYDRIRVV
ncbi:M23 family metallopeptidase [Kaarinaea lacus]